MKAKAKMAHLNQIFCVLDVSSDAHESELASQQDTEGYSCFL